MPFFFPASILPQDGTPEITFDLVISESHEDSCVLTKHPVERGAPITDHIKHEPSKVSLVVCQKSGATSARSQQAATQIKVSERGGLAGLLFPPLVDKATAFIPDNPAEDAAQILWDQLRYLKDAGTLVDVPTSKRTYFDMVITKISFPVSAPDGLEMTLDFENIRTATSAVGAAPKPKVPAGAPPANKGAQTPTPTPPADQPNQSVAAALIG